MKERPILFSAPMVRALLEGRKTQTRRVAEIASLGTASKPFPYLNRQGNQVWGMRAGGILEHKNVKCPYGQPGDRLWVRETWQHSNHPFGPCNSDCDFFYRADYHDDPHGYDGEKSLEGKYRQWRPSSNMPRYASRFVLDIVNVRAERLQSITAADAIAEGVQFEQRYPIENGCFSPCDEARAFNAFLGLWRSINDPESWNANPWVWVVEFRRVTP